MSVILSLGCQFEQAELIKAQELILQGNEEKAFDLYEKIIQDNPKCGESPPKQAQNTTQNRFRRWMTSMNDAMDLR